MLIKTKHKPDMMWHAYSQHSVAEVEGCHQFSYIHFSILPQNSGVSVPHSTQPSAPCPKILSLRSSLLGLIDPLVASLPCYARRALSNPTLSLLVPHKLQSWQDLMLGGATAFILPSTSDRIHCQPSWLSVCNAWRVRGGSIWISILSLLLLRLIF